MNILFPSEYLWIPGDKEVMFSLISETAFISFLFSCFSKRDLVFLPLPLRIQYMVLHIWLIHYQMWNAVTHSRDSVVTSWSLGDTASPNLSVINLGIMCCGRLLKSCANGPYQSRFSSLSLVTWTEHHNSDLNLQHHLTLSFSLTYPQPTVSNNLKIIPLS